MAGGASHDPRPYGRRTFLAVTLGGLSSLWWGQSAWSAAASALSPLTGLLPEGLDEALPSPSSGWRIYNVNPPMPRFDPERWRLRIDGLVERPVTVTYDQVRALPRAEQTSDFHCVTGWSVLDVAWAGVRLESLFELARPLASANAVGFVSREHPYADTLTLEQALLPDVLLAYEMDGKPLSRPHGAPVRVIIPRMYGYKGVKWLNRIVLLPEALDGYWEQRGYDRDAWVGGSNGLG